MHRAHVATTETTRTPSTCTGQRTGRIETGSRGPRPSGGRGKNGKTDRVRPTHSGRRSRRPWPVIGNIIPILYYTDTSCLPNNNNNNASIRTTYLNVLWGSYIMLQGFAILILYIRAWFYTPILQRLTYLNCRYAHILYYRAESLGAFQH